MALAITVSLNRVRQTWTGHCGSAPAVPFRQSPFPGRLDTGPSVLEAQTSVSRFRSDQPYQRPSSRWHLAGTQRLGEIPNSWRAGDLVAKSGVAAGSAARRPE